MDSNKIDYKPDNHSETNSPKPSPLLQESDSNLDDFKSQENFNNNDDYNYRKSDSEPRQDDDTGVRPILNIHRDRKRKHKSPSCDSVLKAKHPCIQQHPHVSRHPSDSQVSFLHFTVSISLPKSRLSFIFSSILIMKRRKKKHK